MGKKGRKNRRKIQTKARRKEEKMPSNFQAKSVRFKEKFSPILRLKIRKTKGKTNGNLAQKLAKKKPRAKEDEPPIGRAEQSRPKSRVRVPFQVKNRSGNSLEKSPFLAKKLGFDLKFLQKRKTNLKIIEIFSIFLKFQRIFAKIC